jgi:hypothetical protein
MDRQEDIVGLYDDTVGMEYQPHQSGILLGAHHGQEKLYAVEKLALFKWSDVRNVVYAGAAPGHHLPKLVKQFPAVMFYLVDPAFEVKQESLLLKMRNIRIFKQMFTDALAKQFVEQLGNDFVFWSDIRSDKSDRPDFVSNSEDRFVVEDMTDQMRWHRILGVRSMLKFRAPWQGYPQGYPYLDGVLVAQPWARASSCELRLFCDPDCGVRNYGWRSIEQKMYCHNMFSRPEVDFELHKLYTNEDAPLEMYNESKAAADRGALLRIGYSHFRPDLMRKYLNKCTPEGASALRNAYRLYKPFMCKLPLTNEMCEMYRAKESSGDAWKVYTVELLRVYCEMKVLQRYSESDYALVQAHTITGVPNSVVSLGGGIGAELLPFVDRFGCDAVSVDISRTSLQLAKMANLGTVESDAYHYEGQHDIAICSYVPFLLDDITWLEDKLMSGQFRYVIIINRSKLIRSSRVKVAELAGNQMFLLYMEDSCAIAVEHKFRPPYNASETIVTKLNTGSVEKQNVRLSIGLLICLFVLFVAYFS